MRQVGFLKPFLSKAITPYNTKEKKDPTITVKVVTAVEKEHKAS